MDRTSYFRQSRSLESHLVFVYVCCDRLKSRVICSSEEPEVVIKIPASHMENGVPQNVYM